MTKTQYAYYAPLAAMHPEMNLHALVDDAQIGCPYAGAASFMGMLANV